MRFPHSASLPRLAVLAALAAAAVLPACMTTDVSTGEPAIKDVLDTPYDGPKARIAVVRFENKVEGDQMMAFQRQMAKAMLQAQQAIAAAMKTYNKSQGGQAPAMPDWASTWVNFSDPISDGIKDMLVRELLACDRFLVYERENVGDLLAEQDLGAAGRTRTKIPKGQLESVELYVYGAITEFEAETSGGEMTIPIPAFGHTFDTDVGYKKARAAIDLRLVDTRTGRIVNTTTVKGAATDFRLGTKEKAEAGEMPKSLSGYKNTPIEAAIRKMVRAAAGYIAGKTPAEYYHFDK